MITSLKQKSNPFIIAWALGLLFYAVEYAVRSAPSIMMPQLTTVFSASLGTVSSIVGTYYLTYSLTSLAAGLAIDRLGAKYPLFVGVIILGIGCVLFSMANTYSGYAGRLMQGMGSALAFPACVYLAARAFSPRHLATAIGATQSLGMIGGSAGQFLSAPILKGGVSLISFWIGFGLIGFAIAALVYYFTPNPGENTVKAQTKGNLFEPYKIVLSNPQSYLSGLVSGLLFSPTTIFAMTWGVAFFQSGRGLDYSTATIACALVPMGWAVGCPLMGWLADKIGKRKPVLAAGAIAMALSLIQLCYLPGLYSPYISMFILGVVSGAAMIPYSIIKEANPDNVKGSATGIINFLTFGVTSLLGPVFSHLYGTAINNSTNTEAVFKQSLLFFVFITLAAATVSLFLKETGSKRKTKQ
ncbi:MFS transporter [Flavobacterium sp. Sd200]|uniref:MFS transporter n=1 Tax=Flavobacterium sp. Sd200 TaxID=2692211 RepID=UPI00136C3FED|nr:MFS transporter [Flavobacterium sp. Sd200]MXN93120.1 MFS transporter [Flavobacterium sp. Sd200]